MADTAKTIELWGDKKRKAEPAQHIIKFPGGSIEVSRVGDNEYWAHIEVNHKAAHPDIGGVRETKHGLVVDSRVDYSDKRGVLELQDMGLVNHIAIRITTHA